MTPKEEAELPRRSSYTVVSPRPLCLPRNMGAARKTFVQVTSPSGARYPRSILELPNDGMAYLLERHLVPAKDRVKVWLAQPLESTEGGGWAMCSNARRVVIKEADSRYYKQYGAAWGEDPFAEAGALAMMRCHAHPNVVRVEDLYRDVDEARRDVIYIVLPHLAGEDMYWLVRRHQQGVEEHRARGLLRQMVQALLHLKHGFRLRHGDVSPENFMVSQSDEVVAIDFGMTEHVPSAGEALYGLPDGAGALVEGEGVLLEARQRRGKVQYMAPEVYEERDYDAWAPDVWSLGHILYILLTGVPIYQQPMDQSYLAARSDKLAPLISRREASGYTRRLSDEARDLVVGMMRWDMHERLTLEGVLEHPWLAVDANNDFNNGPEDGANNDFNNGPEDV